MAYVLEIHHVNVGAGDATVIVVKDENDNFIYKVLIDAGTEGENLVGYLGEFIRDIRLIQQEGDTTVGDPMNTEKEEDKTYFFDLVIASHYHEDHIKGFTAFRDKLQFDKVMDMGGYEHKYYDNDKNIKNISLCPVNAVYSDTWLNMYSRKINYWTWNTQNNKKDNRVKIPFIDVNNSDNNFQPIVIELGEGTDIKLTCYCANGILANGINTLKYQKNILRTANLDHNPNDLSLAFMLEWPGAQFKYFTAGDLSANKYRINREDRNVPDSPAKYKDELYPNTGDKRYPNFKTATNYFDQATPLIEYLNTLGMPLSNGKVDVLKVAHHGSQSNNHIELFEAFRPDVMIVPAKYGHFLPDTVFLREALHYCKNKPQDPGVLLFVNDIHSSEGILTKYDLDSQLREAARFDKTNLHLEADNETISQNTISVIVEVAPGAKSATTIYNNEERFIDKSNYKVFIKNGKPRKMDLVPAEEEQMRMFGFPQLVNVDGREVRPKYAEADTYKLYDIIIIGIREQVGDEIERWVNEDESNNSELGKDYIKEYYPSFLDMSSNPEGEVIDKGARIDKAIKIFKQAYDKPNNKHRPCSFNGSISNLDDFVTLYYCLNNKFQLLYLYSRPANRGVKNSKKINSKMIKDYKEEPYFPMLNSKISDTRKKVKNMNKDIWDNNKYTLEARNRKRPLRFSEHQPKKRKKTDDPMDD